MATPLLLLLKKGNTVTPPAKRATPSLKDLLNKDEKSTPEETVTSPEEIPSEEAPPEEHPLDNDDDYDEKENEVPFVSPEVVALKTNKTPAELAAESPAETAERYNINTEISDEDADNPRVQVYRDTLVNQVPSGTHLHPDIAKDLQNRGIAEQHTDNAQVKRQIVDTYDFAPDAEYNDKM